MAGFLISRKSACRDRGTFRCFWLHMAPMCSAHTRRLQGEIQRRWGMNKGMTHWFMGTPNMWHHGLAPAGRRMSESERTMSRMKEWWVTDTDPCGFRGGMSVKDRGIEGQEEDGTAKQWRTGAVYEVQTLQGSQWKTWLRINFSVKLLTCIGSYKMLWVVKTCCYAFMRFKTPDIAQVPPSMKV